MNTKRTFQGAVRWKLKKLMDERKIGATELASVLGVNQSNVTRWRQAKYLPQINEIRWLQIVSAINEICSRREHSYKLVELNDLVEFCPDEQRDFDIFDYQYASGDARKKAKNNKEKEETNSSAKNTIAA